MKTAKTARPVPDEARNGGDKPARHVVSIWRLLRTAITNNVAMDMHCAGGDPATATSATQRHQAADGLSCRLE